MITIVAKHITKDGKITAFKTLAQELILETRKETGNIMYNLFEDLKSKTHSHLWENGKVEML